MAICAVLLRAAFDLGTWLPYWFEVCYEIINALSLEAPHCAQFSSLTGLPALQPECQNKTTLVSHLSRGGLEQDHPSMPRAHWHHEQCQSLFWFSNRVDQGEGSYWCPEQCSGQPSAGDSCWAREVPVLGHVSWHEMWQLSKAAAAAGRGCQPWGSSRARESPSSAVSINSSLPRQVNVITEPAQMVIHSMIWNSWGERAVW